jgi:WD40 repeat protein
MDRRSFLASVPGLLTLASAAIADEQAPPAIARLISQLGSKRFKEREAAAKALEKMGEKALPALRKAAVHHPDAETRRCALVLVKAINKAISGEVRVFGGHTQEVKAVAWSGNGRTALSASLDETIRLWDVATGQELRCFGCPGCPVWSIVFAPGDKRALSGDEGCAMRLWDLENGKKLQDLHVDFEPVSSVALAPNGLYALCGTNTGVMQLWHLAAGKKFWEVTVGTSRQGLRTPVRCVAFCPSGKRLLSCADHEVRVWDLDGQQRGRFHLHNCDVFAATFSPDGHQLGNRDVQASHRNPERHGFLPGR